MRAAEKGVPVAEIARTAIRRYLAGINPEHEELLERLSRLESQVGENALLVAATMTAAILIRDNESKGNEDLADMVRKYIAMASSSAGKALQHIRDGMK